MSALTPEQEALKRVVLAAIEPHKGKLLAKCAQDSDEFRRHATPTAILALLAQLEAVQEAPNVPAKTGTALHQPVQAVPDGWKLVPIDLTEEMTVAFAEVWYTKVRCIDDCEMDDCYAAMLDAAPTAPREPGQ